MAPRTPREAKLPDLRQLGRDAKDKYIHWTLRDFADDYSSKDHKALWKAYYENDTTTVLNRGIWAEEGTLDRDWLRIMKTYVDTKRAPTPREVGAKMANPLAKAVSGFLSRKPA